MNIAERILDDARWFKKSHKHTDYHDYEYFKQQLHAEGVYGKEKELADILKV